MYIAVGSLNPVKCTAVEVACARAFAPEVRAVRVQGVDVPTGVSAMPRTLAECVAGAHNRAVAARQALGASLGVGLEGGVEQTPFGLFLVGWVVVVNAHGREGIGSSGRVRLPEGIAQRVLAGEELGPLMDELVGREKTNHQEGAIGILSGGQVVRQDMFVTAVLLALAPFTAPDWYKT